MPEHQKSSDIEKEKQTVDLDIDVLIRCSSCGNTKTIRNYQIRSYDRRYWATYCAELGIHQAARRDKSLAINQALDAASFFMFGILLRWVTLHRLSPWHGFLHEPTTYASLCYDLMEPYRVWFEDAAKLAWAAVGDDPKKLTAATINELKEMLESDIAVPQTRQIIARKNLLHGVTLGLLSYLTG